MWIKCWKWLEHNRYALIMPICGIILWAAAGCLVAEAESPLTREQVNAKQLARHYDRMVAEFEDAAEEIEAEQQAQAEFKEFLISLASGNVTNLPGMLHLFLGGSWIGLAVDNIRKGGVIGGLKKKKTK